MWNINKDVARGAGKAAGDPGGLKHPFPMPLNLSVQWRVTLDRVDGNSTGGEEWRRNWGQNQKWGRRGEEVCPGRLEQAKNEC